MSNNRHIRQARLHNHICNTAGVVALRRLGLVEDSYVEAAFAGSSDDEQQEIEALVDAMFVFYAAHPAQAERDERGADYWRALFGQKESA